jgi:hypothetical protein
MHDNELTRLYAQRLQLRQQLEWREANYLAGESDDGAEVDLRERISDLAREIAALEKQVSRANPV